MSYDNSGCSLLHERNLELVLRNPVYVNVIPGFSGRPPRAVNRKIDTLGK